MTIHPRVRRLMTILPKPKKPIYKGNTRGWRNVEAELGIPFPDDYKSFIDVYGQGIIDDEMWLHNPFSPAVGDDPYNYAFQLRDFQKRFAYIRESHAEFKDAIWPAKDGLLPLGGTGFGNEFAWRTKGVPNDWTVLVFETRSVIYHEFDMGIVAFLDSFLRGELATSQPPYHPKPPFTFKPYEPQARDPTIERVSREKGE